MLNSGQSKYDFYLNYDTYLVSSIGVLWAWRTFASSNNSATNILMSYFVGLILGKIVVSFGRGSLMLDKDNSKLTPLNFIISLLVPVISFFIISLGLTYWRLATGGCPDC